MTYMHIPSPSKRSTIAYGVSLILGALLLFISFGGYTQVFWEASILVWISCFSLVFSFCTRWAGHARFHWLVRVLALASLLCIGGIVFLSRLPDKTTFSKDVQLLLVGGWATVLFLCSQFVAKKMHKNRMFLFLWFPILYGARILWLSAKAQIDIIIWILGIALLLEGSIRAIRVLLFPKKYAIVHLLPQSFSGFFFHRFDPFRSIFSSLQTQLGIDIASANTFVFFRRVFFPLCGGLILFFWGLSSFVLIHPHEKGLRFDFGVPQQEVLSSGLHLKWPWPWGEIKTVSSARILSMKIGHEEEDDDGEKESILWANQHAEEEFSLLMGDQVNLISVDGTLQYQITDPKRYLLSWQNPEEQLKDISYQILSRSCAKRNLEDALSENLQVLSQQVLTQIQKEAEQQKIGITPIAFTFSALHPPVRVARDYQSVVSAQIQKESTLIRAQAYRKISIPQANIEAQKIKTSARKDAYDRIAQAKGKAQAFLGLYETVHRDFDRYIFQRRLDVLKSNLKGIRLTIVDHTLEEEGASLWIEE